MCLLLTFFLAPAGQSQGDSVTSKSQTTALVDLAFESKGDIRKLRRWQTGTMDLSFNIALPTATPNVAEFDAHSISDPATRSELIARIEAIAKIVIRVTSDADPTRQIIEHNYGSFVVMFYSSHLFEGNRNPFRTYVMDAHLNNLNGREYSNPLASSCIGRPELYEHPFNVDNPFEGEIQEGSLSVNLDEGTDKIVHCVYREVFRMLGIQGRTTALSDSMFSPGASPNKDATAEDFAVLHLLYSPQLSGGMTDEQALKALNAAR
jgi:hypothetical protein